MFVAYFTKPDFGSRRLSLAIGLARWGWRTSNTQELAQNRESKIQNYTESALRKHPIYGSALVVPLNHRCCDLLMEIWKVEKFILIEIRRAPGSIVFCLRGHAGLPNIVKVIQWIN
jgi:hypothetical protein